MDFKMHVFGLWDEPGFELQRYSMSHHIALCVSQDWKNKFSILSRTHGTPDYRPTIITPIKRIFSSPEHAEGHYITISLMYIGM